MMPATGGVPFGFAEYFLAVSSPSWSTTSPVFTADAHLRPTSEKTLALP